MKKSHFFGDWWFLCDFWCFLMAFLVIFWLGLGNPRHIATKSQQIKFWSILKKSWDWVRPPPPSLGQIPNFYRKFVLRVSLYGNNRTPAHSFPARNDKLVIPESFWPEQGWSERIRALAFRHGLFIRMSFWFRPTQKSHSRASPVA